MVGKRRSILQYMEWGSGGLHLLIQYIKALKDVSQRGWANGGPI